MQAKLLEDERWEQGQGRGPDGKALSRRPDTLARKMMEEKKQTINADACAGHVPGICIGDR